jgi:23S rRNA (cytosine1962-C5)-methyltransferase
MPSAQENPGTGTSRIWKLKSGFDRRFRAGHPWVYSNELDQSPKGITPGEAIELRDSAGKFLAFGFGNPGSLISFRTVSRSAEEKDALETAGILRRLEGALSLRRDLGLSDSSFRLCFGESDHLPGLVIDRYRLVSHPAGIIQVLVIQAHTAGMDVRMDSILAGLRELVDGKLRAADPESSWGRTAVVLRNDIGVRKLEGISTEGGGVIHRGDAGPDLRLNECTIRVAAPESDGFVQFKTDLAEGQKTGFFLDQSQNIELAGRQLRRWLKTLPKSSSKRIRILDLCCYVGQWGTRLSAAARREGFDVEVVAVDASARALEFAKGNIEFTGALCTVLQGDVLKDLVKLDQDSFDVVISDPPALVKSRKDLGPGAHAYLQMNTQAMRVVKRGAWIVACSCSAQLPEEDFAKALVKAAMRNQKSVAWVARGGPGADHPVRLEFPEGRYLKAWIGRID